MSSAQHHKTTALLDFCSQRQGVPNPRDGTLWKRCRAVVSMEQKVKANHACFLHKSLKHSLLES